MFFCVNFSKSFDEEESGQTTFFSLMLIPALNIPYETIHMGSVHCHMQSWCLFCAFTVTICCYGNQDKTKATSFLRENGKFTSTQLSPQLQLITAWGFGAICGSSTKMNKPSPLYGGVHKYLLHCWNIPLLRTSHACTVFATKIFYCLCRKCFLQNLVLAGQVRSYLLHVIWMQLSFQLSIWTKSCCNFDLWIRFSYLFW